jgi:agmatinase
MLLTNSVLLLITWASSLPPAIATHQGEAVQQAKPSWSEKYGGQEDLPYSGPLSYSHLRQIRCLEDISEPFDIAILGMPFDTAVSYRPGARFGPYAIRSGSRRQRAVRGYTLSWGMNPYTQGQTILDCGDVRVLISISRELLDL